MNCVPKSVSCMQEQLVEEFRLPGECVVPFPDLVLPRAWKVLCENFLNGVRMTVSTIHALNNIDVESVNIECLLQNANLIA